MGNEIEIWLLAITLLFPRLGLVIAWFAGQIPYNTIPFIGDVVLAILLPRLLMVIYISTNLGTGNPWFWAHLILAFVSFLSHTARTVKIMQDGKNPYDFRSYLPEKIQ